MKFIALTGPVFTVDCREKKKVTERNSYNCNIVYAKVIHKI